MPNEEYWRWTASEAVASLKKGDIKPVELIEAARSRIEAIDPIVNALPIRCFERATEQAGTADPNSLLAGLPIAVKDYNDTGGVRTTYGSPIFAEYVPKTSDATVSRLEENGAIPIAKSNVPEWAGGHTFNPVNGLTRNPWHTERSAGGSSGGTTIAGLSFPAALKMGGVAQTLTGGGTRTKYGVAKVYALALYIDDHMPNAAFLLAEQRTAQPRPRPSGLPMVGRG